MDFTSLTAPAAPLRMTNKAKNAIQRVGLTDSTVPSTTATTGGGHARAGLVTPALVHRR